MIRWDSAAIKNLFMGILLLTAGVAATAAQPNDAYGRELLATWNTTAFSCSVDCWDGVDVACPAAYHRAYTGGNRNEVGGGSHAECKEGRCDAKHPGCDPDLVASMVEAVLQNDVSAIERLVAAETRITLNVERGAVQISHCTDSEVIVAHIPLSDRQVDVLMAD